MVTITSHIFINIFQTVHFPAVKFSRGNEKNTSFLLISEILRKIWSDRTVKINLDLHHIFMAKNTVSKFEKLIYILCIQLHDFLCPFVIIFLKLLYRLLIILQIYGNTCVAVHDYVVHALLQSNWTGSWLLIWDGSVNLMNRCSYLPVYQNASQHGTDQCAQTLWQKCPAHFSHTATCLTTQIQKSGTE